MLFLSQHLQSSGCIKLMSQMPVVLLPLHFDRDPANRTPSCLRSVVLRPFVTSDFMTGVPVVPGSSQMPMSVSRKGWGVERGGMGQFEGFQVKRSVMEGIEHRAKLFLRFVE